VNSVHKRAHKTMVHCKMQRVSFICKNASSSS